ncbi:unnamed protein product [Pieris brassicae]|uniref:Uncharacterized protein n=1 Tax=Pieris brassicae TaxID=7116 RepID=A0A9P0XFD7_PIEBR|nr:unnamed protein product [Pieris brassicae]
MEDILCVIKETDPELVPIFVARDLQRLPPVTFDHVDATRLLRDIIKLQDNVLFIKENYATKEMVLNQASEISGNKKREATLQDSFDCNSDPIGLSHISRISNRINGYRSYFLH